MSCPSFRRPFLGDRCFLIQKICRERKVLLLSKNYGRWKESKYWFCFIYIIHSTMSRWNTILRKIKITKPRTGQCLDEWQIGLHVAWICSDVIDNSSVLDIGEPCPNSSRISHIHFRANTLGKCKNPPFLSLLWVTYTTCITKSSLS